VLINEVDGGVILVVHVQPGAKRTAAVGLHGDTLKLAVAAPPREGAANEAVITLLAKVFGVRARRVEIVSGALSRRKRVLIRGLSAHDASSMLAAFFPAK
jgi:hypothetical protein